MDAADVQSHGDHPSPALRMRTPPVISNTFSLVALDPATGLLGSAVASRYFAVGAAVPHLRQGVGAFNTQSCHNHRLALQGLALMETGTDPQTAIGMVVAEDKQRQTRQLLALDGRGRKGVWTGAECNAVAHHLLGETCVAAGNLLAGEAVVEAMVRAMDSELDTPFGLRLIRALQAGEREGGDRRGKQSAAIVTVPATLNVWQSDYVDMRVDDSGDPLADLVRLYEKRWSGQ